MTPTNALPETARAVEALVNDQADAGSNPVELALTMLAAGADILTRAWDAPRTLSAFDVLVTVAALAQSEPTSH